MLTLFILFVTTLVLATAGLLYVGVSVAVLAGKLLLDLLWLGVSMVLGLGKLAVAIVVVIGLVVVHVFWGLFVALAVMALAVAAACMLVSFLRLGRTVPPAAPADPVDANDAPPMSPSERRLSELYQRFDSLDRRLRRLDAKLEEGGH
jgi:hypothetical protein